MCSTPKPCFFTASCRSAVACSTLFDDSVICFTGLLLASFSAAIETRARAPRHYVVLPGPGVGSGPGRSPPGTVADRRGGRSGLARAGLLRPCAGVAGAPAVQPGHDAVEVLEVLPDPVGLHLVQADAVFRRAHVRLDVAQRRDDGDLQRFQEARQLDEAAGIAADAVRDHRHVAAPPVDAGADQQLTDEPGRAVD